jgi:hypothetical protein
MPAQSGPAQSPEADLNKPRIRAALPRRARPGPAPGGFTIAALLAHRDHVIAPIMPGPQPRMGRKHTSWTATGRDYQNLRAGMQTLLRHVGTSAPGTLTTAA